MKFPDSQWETCAGRVLSIRASFAFEPGLEASTFPISGTVSMVSFMFVRLAVDVDVDVGLSKFSMNLDLLQA